MTVQAVHPDFSAAFHAFEHPVSVFTRDGTCVYINPAGETVVWEDITARKRGESELQASIARAAETERQFQTMIEAMPQLAWRAKADGYVDYYNPRWYAYTGTSPQDMEGWGWQAVQDPALLPRVMERWQRSIATGEPFEMEFPKVPEVL